jgi:hypothetical protein
MAIFVSDKKAVDQAVFFYFTLAEMPPVFQNSFSNTKLESCCKNLTFES